MQQVVPFIIPKARKEFVRHQVDVQEKFYGELHRHPEVQLSVIKRGVGTLIAADFVGPYQSGDVFLIGADVPHVFHSKQGSDAGLSEMETLFFDMKLLDELGRTLPELAELPLHDRLWQGVYRVPNLEGHRELIKNWSNLRPLAAFSQALGILDWLLSESEHMEPLHKNSKLEPAGWVSAPRIQEVMKYTLDRFMTTISLDEIASVAHMSKGAFCRYFKKHTRKTYIVFLQEVRLQHAAQLVKQGNHSVTEAAFASGFNHLSYFNRLFKAYFGKTPRQYAKE
jgi:AraC-like DNA-binding protein